MRAKIVGMVVLVGFLALTTSLAPVPLIGGQGSITKAFDLGGLDCALGARESCIDVGSRSGGDCLYDFGYRPGDSFTGIGDYLVLGWCTGVGLWDGLSCAWDWFSNLF